MAAQRKRTRRKARERRGGLAGLPPSSRYFLGTLLLAFAPFALWFAHLAM